MAARSASSQKVLAELLEYCEQNQIFVVGFTPPYEASVIDGINARGSDYQYMKDWIIACKLKRPKAFL